MVWVAVVLSPLNSMFKSSVALYFPTVAYVVMVKMLRQFIYLELWLDTNALHDATVEISSNRMTALKTHSFLLIRRASKQQLATLAQGDTAVGV